MSSLTSGRASATVLPEGLREGRYELDFARNSDEIEAVLRLRFEVFNLEMGEGLDSSYATGRDEDPFDAVCHHLLIRDTRSCEVVGSYRMQTAEMAARNIGFYSDNEYDLSTLPSEVLAQSIEIGRACVAARHRGIRVLFLLWKGLGLYVTANDKRYLFGCSSVKTQDPQIGLRLFAHLRQKGYVHSEIEVPTRAGFECPQNGPVEPSDGDDLPDLIRIYLHYGAKICSSPAIDRQFKTIDFLTLFDVYEMPKSMVRNFLR